MNVTAAGATLSIHYDHAGTVAVLRPPDGHPAPLLFDGAQSLPAGVAVADDGTVLAGMAAVTLAAERPELYVALPGRHIADNAVQVGDRVVDGTDLVAANLRVVADAARQLAGGRPVQNVVIAIPSGWGPRRRTHLRQAAHRAGLPQPTLIGAAEAVAQAMTSGTGVNVGDVVLVCRISGPVGEVTILRRTETGFEDLATMDIEELLEAPASSAADRIAAAAAKALEAAAVSGPEVAAVYCQVPPAALPATAAALRTGLDLRVSPAPVAESAGAAMNLVGETTSTLSRLSYRRGVHPAATFLIAATGAALLLMQLGEGSFLYKATSLNPTFLQTNWAGWGLVAVLVGLAATAASQLIVDIVRRRKRLPAQDATAVWASRLGYGLCVAAAVTVGFAVALAFNGAAFFAAPVTPFLRSTLLSAIPIAGLIAIIGLLLPRTAATVDWRQRLRFPLEALCLAVAGLFAIHISYTGVPDGLSDWWPILDRAGGGALGAAIALLVTPRGRNRVVLATILAAIGASVVSLETYQAMSVVLIVTISLWWLIRAGQAALAALSPAGSSTRAPVPAQDGGVAT